MFLVIPGPPRLFAAEPGIGFANPGKHKTDSGFRPHTERATPE